MDAPREIPPPGTRRRLRRLFGGLCGALLLAWLVADALEPREATEALRPSADRAAATRANATPARHDASPLTAREAARVRAAVAPRVEHADAQDPRAPGRRRVTLVAVDGLTGERLPGARISLDYEPPAWVAGADVALRAPAASRGDGWHLGTTDARGRAPVPVEDDRLLVDRVEAPGMRPARGLRGRHVPPWRDELLVELLPPARLVGTVAGLGDLDAGPRARRPRVLVRPLAWRSGGALVEVDARGRWTLDDVAPWTALRVDLLAADGGSRALEVGLRLEPRETRRVAHDLGAQRALSGRVLAADGRARVAGTTVVALPTAAEGARHPTHLDPRDPWAVDLAEVRRDGTFEFAGLPAGDYWLAATTDSRLFAVVGAPVRFAHPSGAQETLCLEVVHGRRITGFVRDLEEAPVAHALLEGEHVASGLRRSTTTARDGAFVVGPFPAGPVALRRGGRELAQVLGADAGEVVE